MKCDVSEIKSFRHCKRQWQLSSRNQFHLTAVVQPTAFAMGTVFHESLHKLYLGKDIEEVKQYIANSEVSQDNKVVLYSMIQGYYRHVLYKDQERFKVLDIEYHFEIPVKEMCVELGIPVELVADCEDVTICGSIDMICVDKKTNEIWGFEHKTAKNFRNEIYCWMDEQPRLYYAALQLYVDKLNDKLKDEWIGVCDAIDASNVHGAGYVEFPEEPEYYKLGGVYINEVRKLIRASETKRTPLKYPDDDLRNFMYGLLTSVAECHRMVNDSSIPRIPQPDYMVCTNCMYNTICQTYQYADIKLPELLNEFDMEFKVRENDHLDDKNEVEVK